MTRQSILEAERNTFSDEYQSLTQQREALEIEKRKLRQQQSELMEAIHQQSLDEQRILNVSKALYEEQLNSINSDISEVTGKRKEAEMKRDGLSTLQEEIERQVQYNNKLEKEIRKRKDNNSEISRSLTESRKECDRLRTGLATIGINRIHDDITHHNTKKAKLYEQMEKCEDSIAKIEDLLAARDSQHINDIPMILENVYVRLDSENRQRITDIYVDLLPSLAMIPKGTSVTESYLLIKRHLMRYNASRLS
jgi:chromosome segregation ATPase